MPIRLIIKKGEEDVSEDIELTNGKGNPFGWSQYQIVHTVRAGMTELPVKIGFLENGEPYLTQEAKDEGYSSAMVHE